jgi:site-specific DNA-methyltransferase (adenine-specific)
MTPYYQDDSTTIYNGDCLEVMKDIDDKSIDMILCDLPYGTTACKWDTIIPFEPLWDCYKRIIKDNGAIVLTASQPFTSALVMSNLNMFKYDLIWDKKLSSGFLNSKIMQLRRHEEILVFGGGKLKYNPQKEIRGNVRKKGIATTTGNHTNNYGKYKSIYTENNEYFPTSIIEIGNTNRANSMHPTQKPVALFKYLIKTYTNEGELVLDNCMGSGTTAIACLNTNRNFIGIELEPKYVDIANKRIEEFTHQLSLV